MTIRVYSNCCRSCSFEPEIIKVGQSSYKMYSNNIVNSQESTKIFNACTKKGWKLIEGTTYLKVSMNLVRLVFWDRFWFVLIVFIDTVKFCVFFWGGVKIPSGSPSPLVVPIREFFS